MTNLVVPWIGYNFSDNGFLVEDLVRLGYNSATFREAAKGLDYLGKIDPKAQVVIVPSKPVNIVGTGLKRDSLDPPLVVTSGLIDLVHNLSNYSQTPVIVPHYGDEDITQHINPEKAKLIDLTSEDGINAFLDSVHNHLMAAA